jgi:hypothetical protein
MSRKWCLVGFVWCRVQSEREGEMYCRVRVLKGVLFTIASIGSDGDQGSTEVRHAVRRARLV